MKYNKLYHHTNSIKVFKERNFSNIFQSYDLSGEEKLLKCKIPKWSKPYFTETQDDEKVEAVYLKGYELKDGRTKVTYLLPSKIKKGEEYVSLTDLMPIKIKKSNEVYHGKKVYHWVSSDNMTSVNYPESEDMSTKELIDSWFDIEHSNKDDAFVCKVALLTSHFGGFSRIIGDKGFGKDGYANTLMGITGIGNNISKISSDAKLMKLIDDDYVIFNEISGFSGERKDIVQNFFLMTGDVNTDTYNHSTLGLAGDTKDISKFSYSIIHNPPSYYMEKGQLTFEQMFQPAVFDRFIPLRCEGRVLSKNSFQDPTIDFEKLGKEGRGYYIKFIGRVIWLRNNAWKIPLKYNLDKYDLSYSGRDETSSRWMNTFMRMAQLVQSYSDNEEEFYSCMDKIYSCHKRAKDEIQELGLVQ